MWIKLSEGVFYFGPGGITLMKEIDLRDKPKTFTYRTELYAGSVKIDVVKETIDGILKQIEGDK